MTVPPETAVLPVRAVLPVTVFCLVVIPLVLVVLPEVVSTEIAGQRLRIVNATTIYCNRWLAQEPSGAAAMTGGKVLI